MPRRPPPGQGALDLGEEFAPPKPKLSRAGEWRRHVEDGLCTVDAGWREPADWCRQPAVARPALGAHLAYACDAAEDEGVEDFLAFGDPMCRQHAGDVAWDWLSEMWEPPSVAGTGLYVDRHGSEWHHPSVWVEILSASATAYPASTI